MKTRASSFSNSHAATHHHPHSKQGFTIVELLIVIVVIGILAAITAVSYNGVQTRATVAKNKSIATEVVKKIELWNAVLGYYPSYEQLITNSVAPTPSGWVNQWVAGGAAGPPEARLTSVAVAVGYPADGSVLGHVTCATPNKYYIVYLDPTNANQVSAIPINNPPVIMYSSNPYCS